MLKLKIEYDEDPISPREWDHLGTMVCWHSRYRLGDEQPTGRPEEYKYPKDCIRLPLYLYDHSGLTMNTTGFSCQWDSGQVGWIYVSREKARKEMGWKRITKGDEASILNFLRGEVEEYDKYLTGDVWGFIVEDESGEHLDSCWGFYGEEYCRQEGEDALKWWETHIKEENELQYLEEINECTL